MTWRSMAAFHPILMPLLNSFLKTSEKGGRAGAAWLENQLASAFGVAGGSDLAFLLLPSLSLLHAFSLSLYACNSIHNHLISVQKENLIQKKKKAGIINGQWGLSWEEGHRHQLWTGMQQLWRSMAGLQEERRGGGGVVVARHGWRERRQAGGGEKASKSMSVPYMPHPLLPTVKKEPGMHCCAALLATLCHPMLPYICMWCLTLSCPFSRKRKGEDGGRDRKKKKRHLTCCL